MTREAPVTRPLRLAALPSAVALLCLSLAGQALAQTAAAPAQRVEVIGSTPLGQDGVPLSKTPANVQTLKARDIREQRSLDLADLLNTNIGSVSVSNGTGSPYQNDVSYRGFQATSVLGAPTGLSVHFDGVRLNEPFGSLVNWDLIPMQALARVSLMPGSNPVFGLNSLGGSIVLATKNGRDFPERSVEFGIGSFGRRALSFEAGLVADARTDGFVSGTVDRQDGFRRHSGSEVRQLYGKLRWRTDDAASELQASLALADNRLSGTQGLPQDMLADRASAYTWPDHNDNRMALLALNGSHRIDDRSKLLAHLHLRASDATVLNSNAVLDDGCFAADGSLSKLAGGAFRCADKAPGGTAINAVTGANALALGYARWTSSINTSLLESSIRQRTGGASLQWLSTQRWFGRENALTVGASLDRSRIRYGQDAVLARLVDHQAVETANTVYGFTGNGLAPSATNRPAFTGSNRLSSVDLSSTTQNASLFLTDTLDVSEVLSLTGSASLNVSRIRQTGRNAQFLNDDGGFSWTDDVSGVSYYNPAYVSAYRFANTGTGAAAAPNGVPVGAVAGPETNSLDGSHRYRRVNPAVGFSFRPGGGIGLFGSYSEAMRAPTSIELSCADPKNPCALPTGFNGDPELKPVVARTLELGGRGPLGERGSWNVAVYDTRVQDDIQFIAATAAYGYFANVGRTERRGLEAGLQLQLEALRLSASVGRVEAQYRSAFTTAAGVEVSPGNRIPGIPRDTLKLRAVLQAGPRLQVGASIVAVGSQVTHGNESNADPAGVVPGYALAHLDLRLQAARHLDLTLRVNNLFDRRYSTYGLSNVTSIYTLATQTFLTPAPPRALWLGLNWTLDR